MLVTDVVFHAINEVITEIKKFKILVSSGIVLLQSFNTGDTKKVVQGIEFVALACFC